LIVGRYAAQGPEDVERYLAFVGSRLVFLIDWNRARKRLARLVGKAEAYALLKWAADNNLGHVAFLKAGDVRLVHSALEHATPLQIPPGARLDEWIGREAARSVLMAALRRAVSGVSCGHPLARITDEVTAELLQHLPSHGRHLFEDVADHAAMLEALADRMRRGLMPPGANATSNDAAAPPADLSNGGTNRADLIARHAVRWSASTDNGRELKPLWREADGAGDAIEDTAFLLTLVPPSVASAAAAILAELADVVGQGVREYARCVDQSREMSPASHPLQIDTFLMTADRLVDLGHQARVAKRTVTRQLVRRPPDCLELHLLATIADHLERAALSLSRCGPMLRDYVVSTCLNR
jgi:hypothetical protein